MGRLVIDDQGVRRALNTGGRNAVETLLRRAEPRATARVPVDTGYLRSTIESGWYGDHGRLFTGSGYGAYVERGTRNADGSRRNRPQPYLRPAVGLPPGVV